VRNHILVLPRVFYRRQTRIERDTNVSRRFDGVLAGAPTWWTTHLQPFSVEVGLWNLPVNSSHHIPSSLFPVISNEVFKQCDPKDGIVDGIISDPVRCNFFPEALLCTPQHLAKPLVLRGRKSKLNKIYNDWIDVNDTLVFLHFMLGSEGQYGTLFDTDSGVLSPLGTSWVLNFLSTQPPPITTGPIALTTPPSSSPTSSILAMLTQTILTFSVRIPEWEVDPVSRTQ
jgi:hypothetical protein